MLILLLRDFISSHDLKPQRLALFALFLVLIALGFGFWSVWMTVFNSHMSIKEELIEKFPGTCNECFDVNYDPVPRNGGEI